MSPMGRILLTAALIAITIGLLTPHVTIATVALCVVVVCGGAVVLLME
jgi:hypothetical protein